MTRDLSRLFRPQSIAVVGGGSWGGAVIEQCLRMGYDGNIWPVHPGREHMCGLACHRSVAELPAAPDAAFIAVNRHLTVQAVSALASRGAGGAVCFASGFAEVEGETGDGAGLQRELVAAAGRMPILGPNCYGMINYLDGALLWPDQHGGVRVGRGVAILSQSSNMLINLTMQRRGLPIAYAVAAGNQAQTGLADMAAAVMEDPRVTALGLHIEGINDVRAFEGMAARARALRKPIVALKVGRSEQARGATLSHTASLAGTDAIARAFLRRLAIGVVDTLPALVETLKLLHVHGVLPGRDIGSISSSGGEAALVADAADRHDLRLRPLTEPERRRLKDVLGPFVTPANPLDYHTFVWGDRARLTEVYAAMLGCGFDLSLLVLDFPRGDRCNHLTWEPTVPAVVEAASRSGARTAVVATLPENMPEDRAERFVAAGIAPMCGIEETLAAAETAADIGVAWARPAPAPVLTGDGGRCERTSPSAREPMPIGAAGTLRRQCAPATPTSAAAVPTLPNEAEAKRLLAAHGLAVPAGRNATTPEEAAAAASALGFPVALKALGIAHKSEVGAVRLGLASAGDVLEAARSMPGSGLLVERMVEDVVAELILGVLRDGAHGLALGIGFGGLLAELIADSATLMIPATEDEVRDALAGLRTAPLLHGFRGRPCGHIGAVIEAAMALQSFAEAHADTLLELDVNPLLVTQHGAVAADVLIRFAHARA